MARMHSRRKGKSHSNKPATLTTPSWLMHEEARLEIEQTIEKLAKEGISPSKIGVILRDSYGVPSVKPILGMKLKRYLESKNLAPSLPEDLLNLMKKAVRLHSHLEKHHKDIHNRRALQLIQAKIHRLTRYYKRKKILPEDWRFDIERAKMILSRA